MFLFKTLIHKLDCLIYDTTGFKNIAWMHSMYIVSQENDRTIKKP